MLDINCSLSLYFKFLFNLSYSDSNTKFCFLNLDTSINFKSLSFLLFVKELNISDLSYSFFYLDFFYFNVFIPFSPLLTMG